MRSTSFFFALLSVPLLAAVPAWAQSASAVAKAAPASTAAPAPTDTQHEAFAQRIQVEDASARIDELRVGGETRTIQVTPKGGMPVYDVAPKSGERTWKVLGF